MLGLVAVWILLCFTGDLWWPGTLVLFLPRWVWGLPLPFLAAAAFTTHRRTLYLLAAALWLLAVPLLDLHLSPRGFSGAKTTGDLRVMTYNLGGGDIDPEQVEDFVSALEVDIFAVQERPTGLIFEQHGHGADYTFRQVHFLPWNTHAEYDQAFITRLPIIRSELRDRRAAQEEGGSGNIIRHALHTPRGGINVVNVHLATVRAGLLALRYEGLEGIHQLVANADLRDRESAAAREWADAWEDSPTIVLGDFNLPEESAIYRRHWGSFLNAFGDAGLGFGATKRTSWHGIRIDHILLGPGWKVRRAWVERSLGGDHRPLVADIYRARRP